MKLRDLKLRCLGITLRGEIFLGQRNRGVGGALVHRCFTFIVPPTPSSASGANNSTNEVLPLPDKIEQAARDAKVKALEVLKTSLIHLVLKSALGAQNQH